MAGNSEAWKRYRKDNVKPVGFNLNKNTDADLIEWLESQPKPCRVSQRLIREDMTRNGKSNTNKPASRGLLLHQPSSLSVSASSRRNCSRRRSSARRCSASRSARRRLDH